MALSYVRVLVTIAALCLAAWEASAVTFTVNSIADTPAGGDLTNGVCETAPGNGICTLRAALQKANAFANGGVVITLPAGTYLRTSPYPSINASMTIQGAGLASTIVDAAALDRGLDVFGAAAVTISGITVRNSAPMSAGVVGAGVVNSGTLTLTDSLIVDGNNGGLFNTGTMTVRRSSVLRNQSDMGGGILNGNGTLTVIESLIAYNAASGGGGGISAQGSSKTSVINSTVSNNTAGASGGAGILLSNGVPLVEIFNATIAGNLVFDSSSNCSMMCFRAGGVQNDTGLVRLQNSLLANNYKFLEEFDCIGQIVSLDYNWFGTTDHCTFTGTTTHNQVGGDAMLDVLRLNGGATLTRALLAGSPAIDVIPAARCTDPLGAPLTTDQRGAPRPNGALCDIGAFEGALPSSLFDVNLIRNGDAEASAGASTGVSVGVPNWTVTGSITVVPYSAAGGFPVVDSDIVQGPHGSNFFAGGPGSSDSQATQSISLAAASSAIDSGMVRFYLSGDFGGYLAENDSASLRVTFQDGVHLSVGSSTPIGNFNAAYRTSKTGLFGAMATGAVPVGARYAALTLNMTHTNGGYNDGYADNLRLVLSGGPNTPDLDQHGLTGSWYEPATSGQGFEVEIYPDLSGAGSGLAFVSWFTFDAHVEGADYQRWYTMSGPVTKGQAVSSLTIYENTDGSFNAPPVTNGNPVGTATLSFDSCTSGIVSFTFTDGSGRAGVIPITRLTPNVTCSTTAARPTDPDFALSGNWYDPATSGQGLTVEVNPVAGVLFAAWYTYPPAGILALAPRQRWFTAQGTFTAGARSIPVQFYETTGGAFDAQTFPTPDTVAVGSGMLAFQTCTNAKLDFNFTAGSSAGKSGSISLVRVGPVPPGCV